MAVLAAPVIDWGGDAPQAVAGLALAAGMQPPNQPLLTLIGAQAVIGGGGGSVDDVAVGFPVIG